MNRLQAPSQRARIRSALKNMAAPFHFHCGLESRLIAGPFRQEQRGKSAGLMLQGTCRWFVIYLGDQRYTMSSIRCKSFQRPQLHFEGRFEYRKGICAPAHA